MNMKSRKSSLLRFIAILSVMVGATAPSFAQNQNGNSNATQIKNFGRMDERFYRGAQPKESDYRDLAALGIKTVIDLRQDGVSYEKKAVEASGMRYISIPMSDSEYPKPETIDTFLKTVNNPATGT